jgi:hypothetical protein
LQQLQNFFTEKLDVIPFILQTISHRGQVLSTFNKTFLEVLKETLYFSACVFSNVNKTAQQQINTYFEGDRLPVYKIERIYLGFQRIFHFFNEQTKIHNNSPNMILYREIIQGLLKFLSDICDGFNYNAQNYLRVQ